MPCTVPICEPRCLAVQTGYRENPAHSGRFSQIVVTEPADTRKPVINRLRSYHSHDSHAGWITPSQAVRQRPDYRADRREASVPAKCKSYAPPATHTVPNRDVPGLIRHAFIFHPAGKRNRFLTDEMIGAMPGHAFPVLQISPCSAASATTSWQRTSLATQRRHGSCATT